MAYGTQGCKLLEIFYYFDCHKKFRSQVGFLETVNWKQVSGRIYHIFTCCFCLNKSVGVLMATVMYLLTLGACFCFVGLKTNIRQKRKMSFRKGTFFLQLLFCCCMVEDTWLYVYYSFPLYRFCLLIFEVSLAGSSDSSIFCQLLFRSSCCLAAKSCPTWCNPMDCSTPDFPVFNCFLEFA